MTEIASIVVFFYIVLFCVFNRRSPPINFSILVHHILLLSTNHFVRCLMQLHIRGHQTHACESLKSSATHSNYAAPSLASFFTVLNSVFKIV